MPDHLDRTDLENEICRLQQEISRLRLLLDQAGICYDLPHPEEGTQDTVTPVLITEEHARLLYSVFKARRDVYSKRGLRKDGGSSYYTQCDNFWKYGLCPKRYGGKTKCADCPNRQWSQLTQRILMAHLRGDKPDGTDVIGVYPLLPDETCNFLAFDFDNHDSDLAEANDGANDGPGWMEEVDTLRAICKQQGLFPLVERSRSGKGAHVWLIFDEPVPASLARRFGSALLTKGAETINLKSFKSYDRMLPAQDKIPSGGLGNLIALPLQGQALKRGNSAFIDEYWHAYPDQWEQLRNVPRISRTWIEDKLREWHMESEPLGVLSVTDEQGEDKPKPWEKHRFSLNREQIVGSMRITLANQIYIETANLKPGIRNSLRRMAAFSNPQFYKKQAMGYEVRGIPRIIWCGSEEDGYIAIPRGKIEALTKALNEAEIPYSLTDKRQTGKTIHASFQGKLYPEQQLACDHLLKYDIGILSAATAFGKTAVGAAMIAERKVNTLILVHNREIMKNWVEDLQKFLVIREDLPVYSTPTGRVKHRKSVIGTLYAGHDSLGGIIDIAMIASLGSQDAIDDRVHEYGMVIMDECHHAGAANAEAVLREISARYVYGLTATPKRDDGMEQKIFMQFGPIRWRFTSKERIALQGFMCIVRPRFTALINAGKPWKIQEAYNAVIHDERRNQQIAQDVRECIAKGHAPLLLTRFREHAALLQGMLRGSADHVFLLQGGRSTKEREEIRSAIQTVPADESVLLIAIGQYIGEGFNFPRLDTLMLATPIAWEGNVEQYAGRLHRAYAGKTLITIYDYVDSNVKILEQMFRKRLRAYKKIGYSVSEQSGAEQNDTHGIFGKNEIRKHFEQDIKTACKELIIASPGLNRGRVLWLSEMLPDLLERNIRISVYTLEAEQYPDDQQ
ncbi:MAG: DEAD/DEAH box helicase family protein, partial [Clostridia bacterium]|nr:DEAD/DEAH box helicase family protein [Clostridia bacterium]